MEVKIISFLVKRHFLGLCLQPIGWRGKQKLGCSSSLRGRITKKTPHCLNKAEANSRASHGSKGLTGMCSLNWHLGGGT